MVEIDKMLNAQTVDIGIVSQALTGEMLAQIETVGSNSSCELGKSKVVLQIELWFLAMLLHPYGLQTIHNHHDQIVNREFVNRQWI